MASWVWLRCCFCAALFAAKRIQHSWRLKLAQVVSLKVGGNSIIQNVQGHGFFWESCRDHERAVVIMLIRFTYFGICIDHVVLGIPVRKTAFGMVFWVKNSARCFPQAFAPRQCALDFSRQNKRRNVGGRCSVDNRRTSIPDRRARTCRNGCEHYSLSSYVSLHKSRKVVFKVRNFEFAIFEAFVRNCNCLHKLVAKWCVWYAAVASIRERSS